MDQGKPGANQPFLCFVIGGLSGNELRWASGHPVNGQAMVVKSSLLGSL